MNPSLIDPSGYVTEKYLVSYNLHHGRDPEAVVGFGGDNVATRSYGAMMEPTIQANGVAADPDEQQHSNGHRRTNVGPIEVLTSKSVRLHNSQMQTSDGPDATYKVDLDQTTMIGSALDLDSLGGEGEDGCDVTSSSSRGHASPSVGENSQAGLIACQLSPPATVTARGDV